MILKYRLTRQCDSVIAPLEKRYLGSAFALAVGGYGPLGTGVQEIEGLREDELCIDTGTQSAITRTVGGYPHWRLPGLFIGQMGLLGRRWAGVREILYRQTATSDICWRVSDRLGHHIVAAQDKSLAFVIDLRSHTVSEHKKLGALISSGYREGWLDDDTIVRITQGLRYVVVLPRDVVGDHSEEEVELAGKRYKRGSVGMLVDVHTGRREAFSLEHGDLSLSEIVEAKKGLQFLFSNMGDRGMEESMRIPFGYNKKVPDQSKEARIIITDQEGQLTAKLVLEPGAQLGATIDPNGVLAHWDVENSRVWWWPGKTTVWRRGPVWEGARKTLPILMWDYSRDQVVKYNLAIKW